MWYMGPSRPVIRLLGGALRFAHILTNKADVRVQTIFWARVGATKRELSGVFIKKYTPSSKYMFWECM